MKSVLIVGNIDKQISDIIKEDYEENFSKEGVSPNCNIAELMNYTFPPGPPPTPIRYKGATYTVKKSNKGDVFLHRNFTTVLATISLRVVRNRLDCVLKTSPDIKTIDFSHSVLFHREPSQENVYRFYLTSAFLDCLKNNKIIAYTSKKKVPLSVQNIFFDCDKTSSSFYLLKGEGTKDLVFSENTSSTLLNVLPNPKSVIFAALSNSKETDIRLNRVTIEEGFGAPVNKTLLLRGRAFGRKYKVFPVSNLNHVEANRILTYIYSLPSSSYDELNAALHIMEDKTFSRDVFSKPDYKNKIVEDATAILKKIQGTVMTSKKEILTESISKEVFIPAKATVKDLVNAIETLDESPRLRRSKATIRFFLRHDDGYRINFYRALFGTDFKDSATGGLFKIDGESFVLNLPYNSDSVKRRKKIADAVVKIVKSKTGFLLDYYIE